MNNSDHRDVMETAADWCDRLSNLTGSERIALQQWLTEPVHAQAFAAMRRTMLDVALLDAAQDLAPREPAKPQHHWRHWLANVFAEKATWGVLVTAATVLCAVVLLRPHPAIIAHNPVPHLVFATQIGERRDATLVDKSVLYLNADTQIAVDYTDHARLLTLARGEAIFQVAKDKSRPFRVTTGVVTVTAVGTRFGVDRVGDAVEVRVYEGTVTVAGGGMMQRPVSAGQWLIVDPQRGTSSGTFAPDSYANWRGGWLSADNMPLSYVVAHLNRYTAAKIVIVDRNLAGIGLNGRFRLDNAEATVQQIAILLDADVLRRDGEIQLQHHHP